MEFFKKVLSVILSIGVFFSGDSFQNVFASGVEDSHYSFKVYFVGNCRTGKSCAFELLVTNKYEETGEYKSTIGWEFALVLGDSGQTKLQLWEETGAKEHCSARCFHGTNIFYFFSNLAKSKEDFSEDINYIKQVIYDAIKARNPLKIPQPMRFVAFDEMPGEFGAQKEENLEILKSYIRELMADERYGPHLDTNLENNIIKVKSEGSGADELRENVFNLSQALKPEYDEIKNSKKQELESNRKCKKNRSCMVPAAVVVGGIVLFWGAVAAGKLVYDKIVKPLRAKNNLQGCLPVFTKSYGWSKTL